jgi:hypothetical protein
MISKHASMEGARAKAFAPSAFKSVLTFFANSLNLKYLLKLCNSSCFDSAGNI